MAVFIIGTFIAGTVAQLAIEQYDRHFDLTRHQSYTPDESAVDVIDALSEPVEVIYFGHENDPAVARLRIILESFARRQALLSVQIADPDKDPVLARRHGVNFYNVAVVAAAGRRGCAGWL